MSEHRFSTGELLIDRYRIERFHGAGGMQEVYESFDTAFNRPVAVKTPKEGITDRRFARGAEMGARVNHPNVAATFDYFEDDKMTFMVEEYIEGSDLGRRLSSEFVFMDPALAAHVIHHIARALYEAHKVGICHRDMKPSNVMTSPDEALTTIKLTDFGIAKLAKSEIAVEMARFEKDESTLTSSNTLLGAVPYMAPECWADWKNAGQPMDIWALGCIAYQLLVGEPPFGTGRAAIANVIRAEQQGGVTLAPPAWFGTHASTAILETALWEIITSCVQVKPADRASGKAVVEACDVLCYASAPRSSGVVQKFSVPYAGGGKGNFGYIDDRRSGQSWFFHRSDFYGGQPPARGQNVSFSVYPGAPNPRCSPVLLLR